jgi:peroxiredoxin
MPFSVHRFAALLAALPAMAVLAAAPALPPNRSAADARSAVAESSTAADGTGQTAANFALRALDGHTIRLSDFRGKVVLLNFWATWCAPCRVEMPWLVEFHQRYRSRGLEVVGVALDDGGRDEIARFVRERHVDYIILLKDDAVADAYGGGRFLPQTFLIGRDGRILRHGSGLLDRTQLEIDIRRALSLPQE